MDSRAIAILWDRSLLWGIMAWRALRSFGARCRLTSAQKIAQGWLLGKQPAVLLAPGGNARQKAEALGNDGMAAIRAYVAAGGHYLGFCGGAGLALTHADGLGLCPWQRKSYLERLYHLVSGHVMASVNNRRIALPVWWPGRFEPVPGTDVSVLATYQEPGPDFWLADLPLMEAPEYLRQMWHKTDRLDPGQVFPAGQPLVIGGAYGSGTYILSYSHLETPQASSANAWLYELLMQYGASAQPRIVPDWDLAPASIRPADEARRCLHTFHARLYELITFAQRSGLFFPRTSWLLGWRPGAPGITFNHLLASLALLAALPPEEPFLSLWQEKGGDFARLMDAFFWQAEEFLWNFRLARTLGNDPVGVSLAGERERIFGHPMLGGGMAGSALAFLEQAIFADQPED